MLRMLISCRLTEVELVQFFQFNSHGNMFIFAPGAGCTGVPRLVQPGDEMIFSGEQFRNDPIEAICSPSTSEISQS